MNESNLEGNVYNMDGILLKSGQGTTTKETGYIE